jgi:hypothetical protein
MADLADNGNPLAQLLQKLLDSAGQSFLRTSETVLRKPADQDVVVELLNAIVAYFAPARLIAHSSRDIHEIVRDAEALCESANNDGSKELAPLKALLDAVPNLRPEISAMLVLSRVDDEVVTPIFAQTDAVGTVMRRKLEPVTTPIFEQLAILQGKG